MKTPRWTRIAVVLLAESAWLLDGQTLVDLSRQGRLGTGTVLPAQCAVGQVFFRTNVAAGANLYACTAPNVWTAEGGGSVAAGSNGQFVYNNAGTIAGSNLSQNSDGSLSASTGLSEKACAVAFSTTLSFNAANCNRFEIGALTANVTASSISGQHAGQHLKFPLVQDGTGGRTITWPVSFVNMCQPWPGPNTTTVQEADVMQNGATVRGTGCTVDSVASSLGTGYLSENYSVGPTAIVANTWLKLSAGKLAPVAGTEGIYGVAPFACAANSLSCEVAVSGQILITAEGPITQDHYLIRGTTNPARAFDSGQSSQSAICSSARIGGRALTSATTGSLVSIQMLSPGLQGAAVCSHDMSAPIVCPAVSASGAAYVCNTSPAFIPVAGDTIIFMPDVASTGSATLSVNGQTPKPLKKQSGAANLVANDLLASPAPYLMTYDGFNWDMQGQTGNVSSGGGGGSGLWPAGAPYYIGQGGGGPVAVPVAANTNWLPGTVYCYDTFDPYILAPSAIASFAGSYGNATRIAIAVFDTAGTRLLSTNLAVAGGGPNWAKWIVTATTLNPGFHSWCFAAESTSGVGLVQIPSWSGNFSNNSLDLSAGIAGAPMTLYTCSIGTTGSAGTFFIPAFGNCSPGHGTRTHSDASVFGIPLLTAYQ